MLDIHSHILHRLDDGPATLENSLELLRAMEKTGITDVVASSHFYSERMPVSEFAERRDKRIDELKKAAKENGIQVNIISGAEVHIGRLILNAETLKPLCFEGTNNILLEIPHDTVELEEPLELIERIISYYNVRPVIAHVERYGFFLRRMKNLNYLKDMGCIIQADSMCFLNFFERRFGLKAIKQGLIDVVASDCHDTVFRTPNLAEAYAVIEKKLGSSAIQRLKENAAMVVEKE